LLAELRRAVGRGRVARMVCVAMTVAGVDPSGGAGIAADLKTFHQHGVYGCSVVAVLTVQNTTSLRRVEVLPSELVGQQLDAVLEDFTPTAAKTGALGSAAVVEVVASRLSAAGIGFVLDPVRIAKQSDAVLLDATARQAMIDRLLPCAALVTANAPEAEWLTELPVRNSEQAERAAERLRALGARAVLIKGGHLQGEQSMDLLLLGQERHALSAPRLDARHTHGAGCTLSAAITANLALGAPLLLACQRAKQWVSLAIASATGVGRGVCGLNHLQPLPD
jgi:hydroxymethylpyrimidine/phosphomethylpyrimidine kinase